MILSMTIELLRYLSTAMESKLIELHEGSKYRIVSADLPGEIKLTLIVFDPPGNSI